MYIDPMDTYYRISPRPLTDADCHDDHTSELWVGADEIPGSTRRGLSCCVSMDALVGYFAGRQGEHSPGRGAILEGAYVTVLEGELSDDEAYEELYGEVLVRPRRIVSNTPVTDGFVAALLGEIQSQRCDEDERAVYRADYDDIIIERRCDTCPDDDEDEPCWRCDGTGWLR